MAFSVDVPNVPGVPSVNFAAGAGGVLSFLVSDAVGLFAGLFGAQQWGIYLGGAPVVLADNVVEVGYQVNWAIADYPIEEGGFESYDKVATPFQSRVQFSTGGSQSDRAAFIASIDAIAGDLNLYSVVTPEKVLVNCNVSRVDWERRGGAGAGMVVANVGLEEIRLQAAAVGANTASPTDASQSNNGAVQTTIPTAAQQAAAVNYTPVAAGQTPRGDN